LPEASASVSGLAGRYAGALFELTRELHAMDAVADDLESIGSLLAESADLRRLIRSPVLSREEQGRAIMALGERAGFHQLTRQFLGVLAHKRRLFTLPDVMRAFATMLAAERGEVSGEVMSAVPLSEAQVEAVQKQLSEAMGKSVRLAAAVDPNLLGGLIVRVGSRMIDASLRTKLQRLELAMKGAA
jgi:F-type H+-transporting ATPase subunit delta